MESSVVFENRLRVEGQGINHLSNFSTKIPRTRKVGMKVDSSMEKRLLALRIYYLHPLPGTLLFNDASSGAVFGTSHRHFQELIIRHLYRRPAANVFFVTFRILSPFLGISVDGGIGQDVSFLAFNRVWDPKEGKDLEFPTLQDSQRKIGIGIDY